MTPSPLKSLHSSHQILLELGIPHGLIGGWAVIAWGRVRATRDVDWLAIIPPSRIKEVTAAFLPFGTPEWRPPGEDDPVAGLIRVEPRASEEASIDILIAGKAADRAALSRRIDVVLGGGTLPAVRPEDIIAMKLQSGGGLDLEDAEALLMSQGATLDEAMLSEACRARRVGALLERIRAER